MGKKKWCFGREDVICLTKDCKYMSECIQVVWRKKMDRLMDQGQMDGERPLARRFFKRAIDAGDTDAFVLYGYARLKFIQDMPGIAEKYATKAVEVDPLHAHAWCLKGQALIRNGDKAPLPFPNATWIVDRSKPGSRHRSMSPADSRSAMRP